MTTACDERVEVDERHRLVPTSSEKAQKLPSVRMVDPPITTKQLADWANRGISGIRLRVKRIGSRNYTCDAWLAEFLDAVDKARTRKQPAA